MCGCVRACVCLCVLEYGALVRLSSEGIIEHNKRTAQQQTREQHCSKQRGKHCNTNTHTHTLALSLSNSNSLSLSHTHTHTHTHQQQQRQHPTPNKREDTPQENERSRSHTFPLLLEVGVVEAAEFSAENGGSGVEAAPSSSRSGVGTRNPNSSAAPKCL
jgi:hypothetical protein